MKQMVMGDSDVVDDEPAEEACDGKRRKLFRGSRKMPAVDRVFRQPLKSINPSVQSQVNAMDGDKETVSRDECDRLAKRMKLGVNISPIRSKDTPAAKRKPSVFDTHTDITQLTKVYRPTMLADGPPPVFSFSKPPSFAPTPITAPTFTTPVFEVPMETPSKSFERLKQKSKARKDAILVPTANTWKRMEERTRNKADLVQKHTKTARNDKFAHFRRQHLPNEQKEDVKRTDSDFTVLQTQHQAQHQTQHLSETEVYESEEGESKRKPNFIEEERKLWAQREEELRAELEKERHLRQEVESKLQAQQQTNEKAQMKTPEQFTPQSQRRARTPRASTPRTRTPRAATPKSSQKRATQLEQQRKQEQEEQQRAQEEQQKQEDRERRKKEQQAEQEKKLAERVQQRKEEMKNQEISALSSARQKEILVAELTPLVKNRFGNKSYLQLCHEFLPRLRLATKPDRDEIRRTLRRAMARYHPDKARHLETFREQIESELIFEGLKEAYHEMVEYCKVHGQ